VLAAEIGSVPSLLQAQFLWFKQPHVTYDKDKVKVTLDESFTLDLPITVGDRPHYGFTRLT
jgi:hypothetical protein